jgi:hypothetical protein
MPPQRQERSDSALPRAPDEHRRARSRRRGRGLISVDPEGGVIRRIPLAASIDGTLCPRSPSRCCARAIGRQSVRLIVSGSKVEGVGPATLAFLPKRWRRAHLLFARACRSLRFGDRRPRGKVEPERLDASSC